MFADCSFLVSYLFFLCSMMTNLMKKITLVSFMVFFHQLGVFESFLIDSFCQNLPRRFNVLDQAVSIVCCQWLEKILVWSSIFQVILTWQWPVVLISCLRSYSSSGKDGIFLYRLQFLKDFHFLLFLLQYLFTCFLKKLDSIEHFLLCISE